MSTLVVSAGYQDEGAAAGIAKIAAAEDSLAAKTIAKSNAVKAVKQAEAAELKRIKQAELNEWKAAENEKDRMLAREVANKKMTFARLAELDRRRYDEERAARKKAEMEAGGGGRGIGVFGGGVSGGAGGMMSGAAGGILGLVGLGGLTAAIGTLTSAFSTYRESALDIAKKGEATGQAIKSFVGIQKGTSDEVNAAVERALKFGAELGLTPEQTVGLAQPLQSKVGTTEDMPDGTKRNLWDAEEEARFIPAARMVRLGVPEAVAGQVVELGVNRGLEPGQAEDWMSLAADVSVTDEPAIAKAVALGGTQFSNLQDALGAATAISAAGLGGTSGEGITPLMSAMSKTIGSAGEVKYEKMFKKYKLGSYGVARGETPLSESENVARLREVAVEKGDQSLTPEERISAFSQNIAKELGIVDVEDSKALGAAMSNFDEWMKVTTGIAEGVADGAVLRKLDVLKANPVANARLDAEKQTAVLGLSNAYGDRAENAREAANAMRIQGAQHLTDGRTRNMVGGSFIDEEGQETELGMASRGLRWLISAMDVGDRSDTGREIRFPQAPATLEEAQTRAINAASGGEMSTAAKSMSEAAAALRGVTDTLSRTGAPAPTPTTAPINRNAGE